jgi:hypothetical protein
MTVLEDNTWQTLSPRLAHRDLAERNRHLFYRLLFLNPLNRLPHTPAGRGAMVDREVFERATRRYPSPSLGSQTQGLKVVRLPSCGFGVLYHGNSITDQVKNRLREAIAAPGLTSLPR